MAVALVFGALASRSFGIYFLMITLTYGVIANLFFGQVTDLSGFGGISGIPTPHLIGSPVSHPNHLYYVALGCALVVYAVLRYVTRTPFGLDASGRRATTRCGWPRSGTASCCTGRSPSRSQASSRRSAGVLFVWWNGHIDPASINLAATINVLVIAVIGGLYRLEGAWLGALVFVVLNNYAQQIGFIGPRFATLIGAIFLVIVLVSPGGLMGLWERALTLVPGQRRDPSDRTTIAAERAETNV